MQGFTTDQRRIEDSERRFSIPLVPITATLLLVLAGTVRAAEAPIPDYYVSGSVTVAVQPAAAAANVDWQILIQKDAGGDWVVEENAWRASGQAQAGLPPGRYPIVFRARGGWAAPGEQEVSIAPSAEITLAVAASRLPSFQVGEIPPQSVRQGEDLSFLVEGAASAVFEPHPAVQRDIAFAGGLFTYRPDPRERLPFNVTFKGAGGEQAVAITPAGASEAEQAVLRYLAAVPDPEANTYLDVTVASRAISPPFNHEASTVRDIEISGPRIVFAPGHPNGLYDGVLGLNGDRDIASLTIYADTVVIRGAQLHLPRTQVTIYARELRFEDDGAPPGTAALNTTPIQKAGTAASGARGEDGSMVTLNVGGVFAPGTARRLFVRGGDGQTGTPGRNGTPLNPAAHSFSTFSSGYSRTPSDTPPSYPSGWSGRVTRRVVKECCAICITRRDDGTSDCPRSGNAAVANGVSGNGGSGGRLSAPFDLRAIADVSRGIAGPSYPTRLGSAGDTPSNALQVEIYFNCFGNFPNSSSDWTLLKSCGNGPGANKAATSPPGPAPANGAANADASPFAWLHPIAIRTVLGLAKDVYLNGHYAQVRDLLDPYAAALAALPAPDKSVELVQVEQEIATLIHRLDSSLDYFGNPAGWVPMLSFEVTFQLYRDEVAAAGDILYLTNFLGERRDEVIDRSASIIRLRNELAAEIEAFKVELEATNGRIGGLEQTAADIQRRMGEIKVNLDNRRAQLEEQAKFNAGLKKAFRVAGAVLPMIPVAQPALAIAGTALTTASKFNEEPPASLVVEFLDSSVPIGIEGFLADEGTPDTDEARQAAKLQKRVQFVAAAATGLSQVIQETQSWESDVDAELNLLVSQDPHSQGLVKEIRGLNAEKLRFAEDLAAAIQKARQLMDGIAQNRLARENLAREAVIVGGKIDQAAFCYIREIERRAKDRLLFYQYLMAKAYEYRMVDTDHGVNYQLEDLLAFYRKLTTPAAIPGDPAQSIVSNLRFDGKDLIDIYTDELREITRKVIDQLFQTGKELNATTFYTLNSAELEQLNQDRSVKINLREVPILDGSGNIVRFGVFNPDEENLRINQLALQARDIRVSSNTGITQSDTVRIDIIHPGQSLIDSQGKVYKFVHKQTSDREDLFWRATYFPTRDLIDLPQPSAASNSLIRTLLGDSVDNVLVYSRPGAWAELTLFNRTGNRNIKIDELTLTINYDYFIKLSGQADLEVRAMSETGTRFDARIALSAPDASGRSDGRGSFHRVYRNGGAVSLEAPLVYGDQFFDRWVEGGVVIGTDPLLQVRFPSGAFQTLTQVLAIYRPSGEGPPPERRFLRSDANADGFLDISDAVSILGYLFLGEGNLPCHKAADANDDGGVDTSDAITILGFLFLQERKPPAPFDACGVDPTADRLNCAAYGFCGE